MEKRTLGSFLAALRRANGWTQRELAEKLNISDKAVSRWERDECAPDLTLIPVIADIFGVTSDELLRGARSDKSDKEDMPVRTVRSDKQIDLILKSNETKYRVRSLITIGILIVGIIVGAVFHWSAWGVLFGGIFLVAAVICQIIFSILAFSAINTDEFDIQRIKRHRRNLINILKAVVFVPELIGFVIVFIVIPVGTTTGRFFMMLCLILFPVTLLLWWIVQNRLSQTEFCSFSVIERYRLRLKIKTWLVTVSFICVTLAGQYIFDISVSEIDFANGTIFNNYDDFKAYMETPTDPAPLTNSVYEVVYDSAVTMNDSDNKNDISGNGLDGEHIEIKDEDGNVLVSYYDKNQSVVLIKYGKNFLPVTTYTVDQLHKGAMVKKSINNVVNVLYLVEVLAGILVYFIIRNCRKDS